MRSLSSQNPNIGALIGESYRLLTRNFNCRVREHGLTQTQWQALAMLAKREGMKQAELAEQLQVQPISLARLVDRMEAAGWIERRPDPRDRRAIQLFLTAKVDPILDEMHAAGIAVREQAMAGMSESEREQMLSLLNRLLGNLRVPEPADPATNLVVDGNLVVDEENDEPQTRRQSAHDRR